jgi:hypothetical protein
MFILDLDFLPNPEPGTGSRIRIRNTGAAAVYTVGSGRDFKALGIGILEDQ